jgi:hypothetical protein
LLRIVIPSEARDPGVCLQRAIVNSAGKNRDPSLCSG